MSTVATSLVSIASVGLTGGQLELHGTVDGQPVDTYPRDASAFLSLGNSASQQAWVADALSVAAQNSPQATVLALGTATAMAVSA